MGRRERRGLEKKERVWGAEDGAGWEEAPPGHSPRAQKTPTLLESENGTFKTSLWLSKNLSGPSQVSTIGDMSFRSEERGTLEPTLPLPASPHNKLPSHPRDALPPYTITLGNATGPSCHSPSRDVRWLSARSSPLDLRLSRSQFTSRTAP